MGRPATPDEVAYACLYLASDEAKAWPSGMLAQINAMK
jgi:NAD(P)-dependent dehydrogenase (short-subunit alcohol dehydrogenase family)